VVEIPTNIQKRLPKLWVEMSDIEKKITATLIAYIAGDAFGSFYEFSEIVPNIPNELLQKEDWPFGATSDDTSLTILTLLSLKEKSPEGAARCFLDLLRSNVPHLRGLGPTTRAALGLPIKESEVASVGFTNGAMMRTALLGLIFNEQDRDIWVETFDRSTHRSYAIDAAITLARAFSRGSFDNSSVWKNENKGISNDAMETLQAIGYVIERSDTPLDAMRLSCSLGGDTDTLAALTASLISAHLGSYEKVFDIPWLEKIDWIGIYGLNEALKVVFSRLATS
jgi:ADP-ribosyl-[dinitrogen reductase] hydrolase